ncbi:MAG: cadherin repeat domain-containing protein, partial [Pseudomonadota bacterium]
MADQPSKSQTDNSPHTEDDDEDDRLALLLGRGADSVYDDPSRSNLHVGQEFTGEALRHASEDVAGTTDATVQKPSLSEAFDSELGEAAPAKTMESTVASETTDTETTPERGIENLVVENDQSGRDAETVTGPFADTTQPESENAKAPEQDQKQHSNSQKNGGVQDTEVFDEAVNQRPEAISLETKTVVEGEDGVVVGQLSVADTDLGDSHSFTVSDDRFEVVDGALRLKPDVALDHEAASEISVDVTATDQGGLSHTQSFTIAVEDINEAPDAIALDNAAVAEGASGVVVGQLSVADTDLGDSHSFTVSDDRFEVVDGALRLKPDAALDHEAASEISVDVTATDQ